jgi:hypothetical protein
MRNFLTLLLLATFGLGFVAGPHPCAPEPGDKGVSPQQPSCHEMASSAAPSKFSGATGHPSHNSHGPKNCCDILCQHACNMVALAGAHSVLFAAIPVSCEDAAETDSTVFRFCSAIEHIPLA